MGDSETMKAPKEPNFRRFSDKLLYSACGVTMLLLGVVWSVTDSTAKDAARRAGDVEAIQQKHAERIIKLEVLQTQNEKHLQSIDTKQSQMEGKIETVQHTLNQVLIELRKGK
jgi:TolA-binding protein